ncbi:hypothetical protein BRADI_1g31187v3 [Brachypodium distachyon]|uniref:USP domain-containing protein n=1 Tax=Brachypodium distachyon TaxID=15368 RepID=A0A0Q3JG67_BRADI|nr:hypothetical protein BRADI_1g31187v3 [Brachypodium distachyon]
MPGGVGGGEGSGGGIDFAALIQAAVVGFVLFTAAVAAVRRAASRYFVVDAAGFASAYDDHHSSSGALAYPMPPQENHHHQQQQQPMAQGQGQAAAGGGGGETAPCAECGRASIKRCSGCKRMRYCSGECQSKHWQSDHKFKCKQMKLDSVDKLPCGGEASSKKSSVFGRISLVPGHRKLNKVIFPYDEFLKLYNWRDHDFLPCGLVNCGNSCFANVVLQCLSCTRPLVAYLLWKDHARECSRRHEDWCFLCELQSHIQKATDSLHPFAPMKILSHLPNIGGNLGFGKQEDAHEFMRFAIDKMQSACLDEFGGEKVVDLSIQETTIIQHIFGGRLRSQVQCTACGMVSNRYENMMDLTVEIHGDAESLEECLNQFTAVEWLDGDNKYRCDGDYVKAQKHLTVHQAPNILTITLKRFQSGRYGKLNKRVTFPTKLDLTRYMSTTDGSDQYDLYAVVVHLDMMNASYFGHYICYIKDFRGRWRKVDDCKVMIVDEEEVHAQGAYMLLYSRRTARPGPLLTVKEPIKQEKQCGVPPSDGQNHLLPMDVTLKCESLLKPLEDLREDSESTNESLHKMSIDQESDMDLHINIERDKFITNQSLHLPVSSASHVLEEATRGPGSLLEDNATMRPDQFGNSACESSSVHSSEEESKEPAPEADYMDIDFEAGAEVERRNVQEQSVTVSSDSAGVIGNKTLVPTFENGTARKPKPLFSPGFLDKPSRKKSSFLGKIQNGGSIAVASQTTNGHWNERLSRPEQGHIANSGGQLTSSATGSVHCNGDMFATASNGVLFNGDTRSGNHSLHAAKRDAPSVNGFNPRPHRSPSSSNPNRNNTSNSEPFLQRGFLERPCSREKSVKGDDGLSCSNATSSSSANGNNISNSNISSGSSKGGIGMSPGLLTKRCRESAAMGSTASFMHDPLTGNISKEQDLVGDAALPDQVQENGIDVSVHGDENGYAALGTNNASYGEEICCSGTKNASYGEESCCNGAVDMHSSSCQRDDAPALLVAENGVASENADHLKSISPTLGHDGLRRRLTSKYFEQNSVDAQ